MTKNKFLNDLRFLYKSINVSETELTNYIHKISNKDKELAEELTIYIKSVNRLKAYLYKKFEGKI